MSTCSPRAPSGYFSGVSRATGGKITASEDSTDDGGSGCEAEPGCDEGSDCAPDAPVQEMERPRRVPLMIPSRPRMRPVAS